ncbi:MAG: acylneuraminate cytidylyltransferase family protein, partial [Methanosarcinaceae archaeon]|nr:acylneuraminate cytidylyltransferase family protein [Methanosarcinaceae archaeon]
MKPNILALIPARGGSKGLLRKNIIPLAGKPLIAWTIEQALECDYIDKLVVSTDDSEIAKISKDFGAEVPFLRPKELARDDSPTIETIKHAIEWFEKRNEHFDLFVLLEP